MVAAALVFPASVAATRPNTKHHPCNSSSLPDLSSSVWNKSRWKRGDPKPAAIKAARRIFACAKHPGPLKRKWERDRAAYFAHRSTMRFRERYLPFYGCTTFSCHAYAIPTQYVDCESGGLGGPYPNIYGIISPTWGNYGGYAYAGSAEEASFREQSIIASAIWADVGSAAWAPFEGGCS